MALKLLLVGLFVATVSSRSLHPIRVIEDDLQDIPQHVNEHLLHRLPAHPVPQLHIQELHHQVPVHHLSLHEEDHAPAHYAFSYGVHDEHTGDIKDQEEKRDGHDVHGRYSLLQPDGLTRKVEYHGGPFGFEAHVSYH